MTILEQFAENGLNKLIPKVADEYTGKMLDTVYDEYSDERIPVSNNMYVPDVFDMEYKEFDDEEEGHYYDNTDDTRFDTLYDLMEYLGFEDLTEEEFLDLEPGEIFGLTNNQLRFIDLDFLQRCSISRFKEILEEEKNTIPDIEQRVKYAQIASAVREMAIFPHNYYSYVQRIKENNPAYSRQIKGENQFTNPIINDYIKRIIFNNTLENTLNKLELLKDYYRIIEQMDNDKLILNVPLDTVYDLTPKPSHLKDFHDKALREMQEYNSKVSLLNKDQLNSAIDNINKTPLYKSLLYKSDKYEICPATDVESINKEGETLCHCVSTYTKGFSTGHTFIYFLRNRNSLDKPFYTIEVSPPDMEKPATLVQIRGFRNKLISELSVNNFVTEWMRKKNIKTGCVVSEYRARNNNILEHQPPLVPEDIEEEVVSHEYVIEINYGHRLQREYQRFDTYEEALDTIKESSEYFDEYIELGYTVNVAEVSYNEFGDEMDHEVIYEKEQEVERE